MCESSGPVEMPSKFRKCPTNCYNLKYNRFLRPPKVIEHPSHPPPRVHVLQIRWLKSLLALILAFFSQFPLQMPIFTCQWGVGSSLNLRPSGVFSQESLGKCKVVGGRGGRRGGGQAVLDSPYKLHK